MIKFELDDMFLNVLTQKVNKATNYVYAIKKVWDFKHIQNIHYQIS